MKTNLQNHQHRNVWQPAIRSLTNPKRLAALCLVLFATLHSVAAKNVVYKGTLTVNSLLETTTTTYSAYVVFGDEEQVAKNYRTLSATFIVYARVEGKKRFSLSPAGNWRAVDVPITVRGKTRTMQVISQLHGSYAGDDFRGADVYVLTGSVTGDFPRLLTGTYLGTDFGYIEFGAAATASASKGKFALTLVRDLTDPIPTGEPLAESVKRVTEYLGRLGYLEIAP